MGYDSNKLYHMCISGIKKSLNITITFTIVGAMTAMWRVAGTLPTIVCYASRLVSPKAIVLMEFLLTSAVSVLTGTAFGTAATMGVICSTMAAAMNIPPYLSGGAILCGCFFGDRCSPVSTSVLLISELTNTDIFKTIRKMIKTALVPFSLSCVLFLLAGILIPHGDSLVDFTGMFSRQFSLNIVCFLPAIIVFSLALMRVKVRIAIIASILSAFPIAMLSEGFGFLELIKISILGFYSEDAEIAAMLDGGGVISMLSPVLIMLVSSAIAGIFDGTGMIDGIRGIVRNLSEKVHPFGTLVLTSIAVSAVICNQTITIIMTNQLCSELYENKNSLALDLEDTSVVIPGLIPWSIASGTVLAAVESPKTSIIFAFFLYLLPLWRLFSEKKNFFRSHGVKMRRKVS